MTKIARWKVSGGFSQHFKQFKVCLWNGMWKSIDRMNLGPKHLYWLFLPVRRCLLWIAPINIRPAQQSILLSSLTQQPWVGCPNGTWWSCRTGCSEPVGRAKRFDYQKAVLANVHSMDFIFRTSYSEPLYSDRHKNVIECPERSWPSGVTFNLGNAFHPMDSFG